MPIAVYVVSTRPMYADYVYPKSIRFFHQPQRISLKRGKIDNFMDNYCIFDNE